MADHTPGPWHYRPRTDDDWGTVRASPTEEDMREGFGGWLVANARSGQMDCERVLDEHRRNKTDPYGANARLIAAAPDLLEAAQLQEAAEDANANCDECEGEGVPELCESCFHLFDDARVKRRLAIAKATGGTS